MGGWTNSQINYVEAQRSKEPKKYIISRLWGQQSVNYYLFRTPTLQANLQKLQNKSGFGSS